MKAFSNENPVIPRLSQRSQLYQGFDKQEAM